MRATIRIDRRFRGPPESGNGGYVCGCLAQFVVGGGAALFGEAGDCRGIGLGTWIEVAQRGRR
jgi:hypothetical protein